MTAVLNEFSDPAALAEALADAVSAKLSQAIADRGFASLAVSGGSTPKVFFKALSTRRVEWDKVIITLVDERFVPPENERSNHLLVSTLLLQNAAASARFVPLYHDTASIEQAAFIATETAEDIGYPFDAVILGMGNDGHTASFFPDGNHLETALDAGTDRGVMTMTAEGAGEPRLTFTFSSLHDAGLLVLHIEGNGKKDVLAKAQAQGDEAEMPIRAILRRAASPVQVYWAP